MRIKNLELKNIGPFEDAKLEFIANDEELENPPVICITGENGTGKSIILDAIRLLLNGSTEILNRDIFAKKDFLIQSNFLLDDEIKTFRAVEQEYFGLLNSDNFLSGNTKNYNLKKDFVCDYWTSKLSNDDYKIPNITALEPEKYLEEALTGIHKNADLTKTISFFDYLKDSKNKEEKDLGKVLFGILEDIINLSIENGKLSHISRMNLKPIVKIGNKEISLDKLSSGNLYLMQRFTSILNQIYCICALNDLPIAEYKNIKGVLLIDEAENHLHPKWQKVFLKNILELFPKLQIIVATHSPFIVSSVENMRVFVCKSKIDYSVVEEETDYYANKPVEEILLSPLFNTNSFGVEISALMQKRKEAIKNNNKAETEKIEEQLKSQNPEYFDYLNLESVIKSINK